MSLVPLADFADCPVVAVVNRLIWLASNMSIQPGFVPKNPSPNELARWVGFVDQALEPVEDWQGAMSDLIEYGLRDDEVGAEGECF